MFWVLGLTYHKGPGSHFQVLHLRSHVSYGSQVSGLEFHLYVPGSQVPAMKWIPGLRWQVSSPTKSVRSWFPLFRYAKEIQLFYELQVY